MMRDNSRFKVEKFYSEDGTFGVRMNLAPTEEGVYMNADISKNKTGTFKYFTFEELVKLRNQLDSYVDKLERERTIWED